jgi:hypothetical protein
MSPKETKLSLNIPEKTESLLLGNATYTLEDLSTYQYCTDDPFQFCAYAKAKLEEGDEIFYGLDYLHLLPIKIDRYTKGKAKCTFDLHPLFWEFKRKIGVSMSLPQFEKFLFTYRPFVCDKGRDLYSYTKNFSMQKISCVRRELDNQGNYRYEVSKANGKGGEMEIPEQITFTLPVIDTTEMTLVSSAFTADVFFTWKDTDGGCELLFTLEAPHLNASLKQAMRFKLDELLKDVKCPKYWGEIKIIEADNSWQIKESKL